MYYVLMLYFLMTYGLKLLVKPIEQEYRLVTIHAMDRFAQLEEGIEGLPAYASRALGASYGVLYFNTASLSRAQVEQYLRYLRLSERAPWQLVQVRGDSILQEVKGSVVERARIRALIALGFKLEPYVGCETFAELIRALGVDWSVSVVPCEAAVSRRRSVLFEAVGAVTNHTPSTEIIRVTQKTTSADMWDAIRRIVATLPNGAIIFEDESDGGVGNSGHVTQVLLDPDHPSNQGEGALVYVGRHDRLNKMIQRVRARPVEASGYQPCLVVCEWKPGRQEMSVEVEFHSDGTVYQVHKCSAQTMDASGSHAGNRVSSADYRHQLEPGVWESVERAVRSFFAGMDADKRPEHACRVDLLVSRVQGRSVVEGGVVEVTVTEINHRLTATHLIDALVRRESRVWGRPIEGDYLVLLTKVRDPSELIDRLTKADLHPCKGEGVFLTAPATVQLGKAIFFVTATTPEQLDRLKYKLYGLLG